MRILLAEDNLKLAKALQTTLEQEHYAVDMVHDGAEAVVYGIGEEYDLIVLDWMMPEMSGLEVCKQLRKEHIKTPILFLTAKDATNDKVDGLDAGADDYLVKPFAMSELLARVRSLLRREQRAMPVLTYGPLSIDTTKKEITRSGERIHLSAKEYALLEYLLRNPEQVLSQTQILDHVWSDGYDGLSNVVAAYIKQLRKKVDKAFNQELPLIHTVRGMGYRLGYE